MYEEQALFVNLPTQQQPLFDWFSQIYLQQRVLVDRLPSTIDRDKLSSIYFESPFWGKACGPDKLAAEVALRYACDALDDKIDTEKIDPRNCEKYRNILLGEEAPGDEIGQLLDVARKEITKNGYTLSRDFLEPFFQAQFIKSEDIATFDAYKELCRSKTGMILELMGRIYVPALTCLEADALRTGGVIVQLLDDACDIDRDLKDGSSNGAIIMSKELGVPHHDAVNRLKYEAERMYATVSQMEGLRPEIRQIIGSGKEMNDWCAWLNAKLGSGVFM